MGLNLQSWRNRLGWLYRSNLDFVFIAFFILNGLLLIYRLADPDGSLIFDESYYVQMARVILGLPVTHDHLPEVLHGGCDPNSEHPPLAKVIMAVGVHIFHDNAIGWRLPSVFLGLLGISMVYLIGRQMGATRTQSRLAAFVLAFDNLYFIHSRIATLDIYMVSFCLLGTWLYLRKNYELSGLAFALATVSKINGLLGVGGMCFYELACWFSDGHKKEQISLYLRRVGLLLVFWLAGSFFFLGALDRYFTEFSGPLAHVKHIFAYGTALSRQVGVAPQGAEATPLQWWLNIKTFEYLSVWGTDSAGNTVPMVTFTGCMNIYLISVAPFVLGYCFTQARKSRLALLCCCLFLANYTPMLAVWIKSRRICYLFYMLPSMPSFALSIGYVSARLPGWASLLMAGLTVYAFLSLFPFPIL